MVQQPEAVGRDVLYEVVDRHIAVITLDRPVARNAIDAGMAEALGYLVELTEADGDIRACILASSDPRAFCAGADLREVATGGSASLRTEQGGFAGFVMAARSKPWIAAVAGFALAGGFELVLACDMVVAAQGSRFGLPETKRGLYAGAGGVMRLPRAIPRTIANEMIATGEPIDAARAYALGLINRLVPVDQLRAEAIALAHAIVANAPNAVAYGLQVARIAAGRDDAVLAAANRAAGDAIIAHPNAVEGAAAFLVKRQPNWKI